MPMEKRRHRTDILSQINSLLEEIPLIMDYPVKGINCLMPCDCSEDIKRLLPLLLRELKGHLEQKEYDSYNFGHFLSEKFEISLEFELYFPDEVLSKLINIFYLILFEVETYSVKKNVAELLTELLKKAKKIDSGLFKADWKKIFILIDEFYYPKVQNCPGFHSYQSSTCSVFIELGKEIRRFFPNEAVYEIIHEFEKDLIAFHPKEALRSARYIALLLPYEGLTEDQIVKIFSLIPKVGEFKRISSQFDIFIVYILKKVTKYNADVLKNFDWEPLSKFVFEQILPSSLKIPSPVKGARKLTKLITKTDVSLGEDFFEALRKEIPPRIAKWIVYTMQGESYKSAIHEKLLFFLDSLRNLCHPSNYGPWNIQIELFLGYFAGALAKQTNKDEKWLKSASPSLIDEIVEKIWNLSDLMVFARSGPALSGLCVSSFTCTNLANIRPDLIVPKMILSISSALESISEPHRTTSAIGLLQVSMPNLMKYPLGIGPVLSLLPTVVFGIDSNDQLKSIRTLSFFLSFSEAARIENISGNSFDYIDGWSDICQEAKELTGQFSDIFLLFTENVISYLKSISSDESKGHDDLSRMILAISNCVYAHVSKEIAEICLEKWSSLLEEDLGSIVTEIVGEIVSKIAGNHFPELFEKLIPKIITKISDKIDKGDGQLGSKDQSNNSLNNNLNVLSYLLENGKVYVSENLDSLKGIVLKVLNSFTNRKTFLAGSRLFHSIVIGLIHYHIKAVRVEIEGNPFEFWAKWYKADELEQGKDFKWTLPSESDGLKALEVIEIILNWSKVQTKPLINIQSKSESEKLYCLLQVIDNLNIDLLNVYNAFSSYNYGINSEIESKAIMQMCQNLLKENLQNLKNLAVIIESTGNMELEIQLVEIIGSVITGHAVNPDKSREKLKALKRLNINYDRYYTDKHRSVSYWMLQAEAQFKLRRDLRFNFGDEVFESSLMQELDDLSEILYKYCFKSYHKIRIISQSTLRRFAYKYIEKSVGIINRTLELVETKDNLTETVFKGVLFLLRSRFTDIICEDFGLIERFLRCLLKLGNMPISSEVNESFEILSGTLNVFTDAYVPDKRNDPELVKTLVIELIKISCEQDEKWTSQYLAMISAHPMIEMCSCSEIFPQLAKLSLSKVSVIRNISQNCFKSAIYGFITKIDGDLWKYRDLTALEIVRNGKLAEIQLEKQIKTWKEEEFKEFCGFFEEYLKNLCLGSGGDEGSGSDGSVQFEYMTFLYLGRWINLLGPNEMTRVIEIIKEIFLNGGSMDLSKQRAFTEIICAIICNTKLYNETVMIEFLRKSWNSLAIENLDLWTAAIDEPLMWDELFLKELVRFFKEADETSKMILGIKMIYIVYSQIGNTTTWIDIDWLISKLINLCSHEYTSIVMESSKLLSLIWIREKKAAIIEKLLSSELENNLNSSRAILQFFACSSTIPTLSDYWNILNLNLERLLQMLQSENVQLLTDAKKAILQLFLAKGAELKDLDSLTSSIIRFIESHDLPVKISKFCIELVQLILQNNFSLFHVKGSVEEFTKLHVNSLIESEKVHFRESSHGIMLTLYQIDQKMAGKDVEGITKSLQKLKTEIRNEKGIKERHGMVIRGSSIVLSEPHVISKRLPALLTALSYYISDRSPISPLVRMTFSEFRRTHQDNWQLDRQLFDEDQLDAIGELLIAPSYYA